MASIFSYDAANLVASRLNSGAANYIGWGTGAGTSQVTDTTIFGESSEDRSLATRSNPSPSVVQWVGTLTCTAPREITNAAVMTEVTGGTVLVKADFPVVTLALTGDSIVFNFTLTVL